MAAEFVLPKIAAGEEHVCGDGERWRPIAWRPAYAVSTRARVWSYARKRVLKPQPRAPYTPNIQLGKGISVSLSTLVADAFLVKPPGGRLRHIDADRTNCSLANLAWDEATFTLPSLLPDQEHSEGAVRWRLCKEDARYAVSTDGRVYSVREEGLLKTGTARGGYARVELAGVRYMVHVLMASAFLVRPTGAGDVDHIDRVRANNNLSNLRYATRSQNIANTERARGREGLGRGLKRAPNGRFQVQIQVNGRTEYLGTHDTEREAELVYARRAQQVWGQFIPDSVRELLEGEERRLMGEQDTGLKCPPGWTSGTQ